jgi:hypothetical protein
MSYCGCSGCGYYIDGGLVRGVLRKWGVGDTIYRCIPPERQGLGIREPAKQKAAGGNGKNKNFYKEKPPATESRGFFAVCVVYCLFWSYLSSFK